MRKTKIICTVGPATDDEKILRKLIENGMNVARHNFSHGDHEEHKVRMDTIKKLRKELNQPVAILLDTKGPEIRTREIPGGRVVKLGEEITLTTEEADITDDRIPLSYPDLTRDMAGVKSILIDDGNIELEVLAVGDKDIRCRVMNNGLIESRKGVNVPGAILKMPILSEKDKADILFGIENDVDYIAASFVRSEKDVLSIRHLLDKNGGKDIMIIAKIENGEGVDNIDEILALADGVMVARGDLGVEVSYDQVPFIQKEIIRKSQGKSKPAIIATQMLDSMIHNPRPTRAEVSDVYNAIFEAASSIMLSGETAKGDYPLECFKVMDKTALSSEAKVDYEHRFFASQATHVNSVTGAITNAAVTTAYNLAADAIIVLTTSGKTAFSISRLRPAIPIITITPRRKVYNQLALNWGIIPYVIDMKEDFEAMVKEAMDTARDSGIVKDGDLVVIVAGMPVGIAGRTNSIRIETVGDVIGRGRGIVKGKASGRTCICRTASEGIQEFQDGDILVASSTDKEYLPLMKRAGGIILENSDTHEHAETVGVTLDIPVISDVTNALDFLKHGRIISLDGDNGLIYTGEI
ncbi:MAG: pyruvate kinase [Spirochaetales bacterium]|nr:pyruvate kinase [Spirochaetales bacterium]